MDFAQIRDGIVVNIISLRDSQLGEFPDCVPTNGFDVHIGDYHGQGRFYRNGKLVKTALQSADDQLKEASSVAIAALQETCKRYNAMPSSNAGYFVAGASPWKPGTAYERFDMFEYGGVVGWVKQAHTAQDNWLPFAAGTESLYGARPVPDEHGIYPYVYNMSASVGMKVRDGDTVYVCIQAIDDMLWPPAQIAAHFVAE